MNWYWYLAAFLLGFTVVYLWYKRKQKQDPTFKVSVDTIESEIGIDTATDVALRLH
jgi:hypothetical protein